MRKRVILINAECNIVLILKLFEFLMFKYLYLFLHNLFILYVPL